MDFAVITNQRRLSASGEYLSNNGILINIAIELVENGKEDIVSGKLRTEQYSDEMCDAAYYDGENIKFTSKKHILHINHMHIVNCFVFIYIDNSI